MLLAGLVFFIFGTIVGSFINVVVLRKGVASLTGRSRCASCSKLIAWYDNIPIISWFALKARCRRCGSRIAIQYPLVEAGTGISFALLGAASFPIFFFSLPAALLLLLELSIVSLLVAITVYDFRHTIILDEWVWSFNVLALLVVIAFPEPPTLWLGSRPYVEAMLAGPLAALPPFLLWLTSHGRWMGLGDAKLALGIGWLLGLKAGLFAVFFSFIFGSIVLLPLMLLGRLLTHIRVYLPGTKGLTMKSEVPFGPFLVASCLIFWFAQLYGVSLPLYVLGL